MPNVRYSRRSARLSATREAMLRAIKEEEGQPKRRGFHVQEGEEADDEDTRGRQRDRQLGANVGARRARSGVS